MKSSKTVFGIATTIAALAVSAPANAGGLFIPGLGAVSTGRAGAHVASVEGSDAIAINPAGMSKRRGTVITISSAFVDYDVSFKRYGTYDTSADAANAGVAIPWAGQAYDTVHDTASAPLGIGGFQAVPLLAISSDLGGLVPGLRVGAAVFGPGNASPSRSVESDYILDSGLKPSSARYDVVKQDAVVMLPSIAASYSITDKLDVGARFSFGLANIKSSLYLWALPQNLSEWTGHDALFSVEAKDNFVPGAQLGVLFRPMRNLEIGAQYTSELSINAKGTGSAVVSQYATIGGNAVELTPPLVGSARCDEGGTNDALKACVSFAVPMMASLGGRYIFRDHNDVPRGDVELNVQWENWSTERSDSYLVTVDAVAQSVQLKDTLIKHGLQDTVSVRLGGSYEFAVGPGALIGRAGVSHDTKTAKSGWERLDLDGAARTMFMLGGSYRLKRFQFDLGGGYVYEGTRENGNPNCNPTTPNGCSGTGPTFADEEPGADPVFPLTVPAIQVESPVNAGTYTSRYVVFTLGMSTWF